MSQVVLKATLGDETHRISFASAPSFVEVRASIARFFPHLPSFRIQYKDEDGDCITVASDADVTEAIRFFGKQPVKFAVLPSDAKMTPTAPAPTPAPVVTPPAPVVAAPAPASQPPPKDAPVFSTIGAREPRVQATPPPPSGCPLVARYVRDVSVPDGTTFKPDEAFQKTWLIRNAGDVAWPEGCLIRFEAGDQLKGTAPSLPVVQVGQEIEITVNFKSPANAGKYVSYWRLCNSEGIIFGDRLWVEIRVAAPEAVAAVAPAPVVATPAPAPAPTPAVVPVAQPPLNPLPAPPVKFAFVYQVALDQLVSMGFADNDRTRKILVRNRGDVARTTADLLDAQP